MGNLQYESRDYFRNHSLEDDPFQNNYHKALFFATPELKHRLDLVKHLLEFSQQSLLIKGAKKVGKTFFAKHLSFIAPENWLITRVKAEPSITPDELVKVMLRDHQHQPDSSSETIALINQYLNFCALNNKVPILILDNAHNLDSATLRFLFQLMDFKDDNTSIRVILIANDSILPTLNAVGEEKPGAGLFHTINIPAFSLEETAEYIKYRLAFFGARSDLFSIREITRMHKVSAGLAGDINFLARQGLSDPAELLAQASVSAGVIGKKSIEKTLLILSIVAILTLTVWLYSDEKQSSETSQVSLGLPEQISPETNYLTVETSSEQDSFIESIAIENQTSSTAAIELNNDALSTTTYDGNKSVANSSDTKILNVSTNTELLPTLIPETVDLSSADIQNIHGLKDSEIRGHDWLQQQSSQKFSLQLIGAVETETILRFLENAELDRSHLSLYKTRKDDNDWYVLLYGLYADWEQAKAAISALSDYVQTGKPWPKPLSSIQVAIQAR
jgi:DamX protein